MSKKSKIFKNSENPQDFPNKQKDQLQQKYLELQLITAQIREQQKQMQLLENQLVELANSKKTLDEFENIREGSNILVPISPGIFAKATLKNNKELIVNVGAAVTVKKTVEDTKKLIEKQFIEIQKIQKEVFENIQNLNSQAEKIEKEISQLAK